MVKQNEALSCVFAPDAPPGETVARLSLASSDVADWLEVTVQVSKAS